MEDNIEIVGKVKLDLSDAEKQLDSLSAKKPTAKDKKAKMPKEATESLKDLFQGEKGLNNIGKLAKSATGGIQSFNNSLSGMAAGLGEAGLAISAVVAAVALIMKLLQGTDTMAAIGEKLEEVFDALREVMAPVLSSLGDIVMLVLDIVKDIFPLLEPALNAVALALKPLVITLQILEPAIRLLGEAFKFIYDIIKGLVKVITFGLLDLDNLMGSTAVKKTGYKSSLDVWETSDKTDSQKLSDAATSLEDAAKSFKNTFTDVFSDLGNIFSGLKDGLVNAATKAWDFTKDVASNAWDGIKTVATNVWGGISNVATGVWGSIKNVATDVWGGIKNTATRIWSGITGTVAKVGEGIGTVASNVWTGVKTAAQTVGSAVANVASDIWSGAKNVASNVGNAIGNFFSKLKFWKDGGTLSAGAQIWGMNETGNPEFLFNSGGTDTVVNANILENAMYNAVTRALESNAQKLEVSVASGTSLGAKELASWILPHLKFNLGR